MPWTTLASLPIGVAPQPGVAAHGGKLYVFGNNSHGYVYDPVTDTWSTTANKPGGGLNNTYAFDVGAGVIYVLDTNGSGMFSYDPTANTWDATLAPLPGLGGAVACSDGTKIYYLNYADSTAYNTTFLPTVSTYDPATDTWGADGSECPVGVAPNGFNDCSAFVIGGVIWVVNGNGAATGTFDGAVVTYTIATDTWAAVSTVPTPREGQATTFQGLGTVIPVIAGDDATVFFYDLVDLYDTVADSWASYDALPIGLNAAGGAVLDGFLYVVGGFRDDGAGGGEESDSLFRAPGTDFGITTGGGGGGGTATMRSVRARTADLTVVSLPAIDPLPADYPPDLYWRDSWHYSAPTFDEDDGWSHPKQDKSRPEGIEGRTKWGRYQIHIGDVDRTFFRGVQVQVLNWSHENPFGPRLCTLRFPQITPFEELGVDIPWLHDQVKFGLHRIKDDGTVDRGWNWNGIKNSSHLSWTPDGWAVDVEFKGFLQQGADANNRPTSPAGAMHAADIGYRIPHRLNQVIGRKFKRIAQVVTGIEQYKKGPLTDSVIAFVLELLALGWTDDGIAWTLLDRTAHRWQAHMVLPDPDTVDYTLALGTEGASFDLNEDRDELANVIYGEWVTPDGARTQNLKYPHLRAAAGPDFPLGLGLSFAPGDGQSGFGPFARWLDRNGYKIFSDTTYDARDEDEVIDAQGRMGVTDDGVVNATTWLTAFDVGAGNFSDAIYLPIAWDKHVEPYLYTPDGVKIGRNPDYDPSVPRREAYVNFGENMERADVKQAARQMVARSKRRSLVGTVTTSSDPEECSFRDIRAGKTLAVPYLDGTGAGGVKFHVASVEVVEDEEGGHAELQVDTLWRDAYTVTQIIERNREARHNPARLRRQNASALTQDTQPVFDRDNGAGQLGTFPLDAATWRSVPFPAAAWGTFVRVHADTSPNTEFALMLFAGKVTSNFCQRNVGDPLDSKHPYKPNADVLKTAGLIQAWGSKDQPCGYSKPGAADGFKSDDDPLTGIFEWDSAVKWWSERTPLLYLAVWAADATEITIRFYNEPVDF